MSISIVNENNLNVEEEKEEKKANKKHIINDRK